MKTRKNFGIIMALWMSTPCPITKCPMSKENTKKSLQLDLMHLSTLTPILTTNKEMIKKKRLKNLKTRMDLHISKI